MKCSWKRNLRPWLSAPKMVFFSVEGDDVVENFLLDRREVDFFQTLDVSLGDIDIEFVQFFDVASDRWALDRPL